MDTGHTPADDASAPAGQAAQRRPARARRIVGAAAAGAILMGGGVAIGVAATGGASAATAPSAKAAAHKCARPKSAASRSTRPAAARAMRGRCHGPLRLALARGIHGQITFKAKSGFRTLAFERGTLESVSGSTLTVRAADGTTWTWHLVANSVIRESRQKVAASKLAKGEQVLVAGPVVSSANDARLVRIRPAS